MKGVEKLEFPEDKTLTAIVTFVTRRDAEMVGDLLTKRNLNENYVRCIGKIL